VTEVDGTINRESVRLTLIYLINAFHILSRSRAAARQLATGSSIHLAHQNKSIRDDQIEIVFINSIKGFGQDLMNRRPVNHCSPFQIT